MSGPVRERGRRGGKKDLNGEHGPGGEGLNDKGNLVWDVDGVGKR